MAFVSALAFLDFRVVAESFDVVAQFHECTERGDARNFALHDLADFVLLEPFAPDVVHLFDAQGDATVLGVDLKHFGGDGLALFKNFVRILDALGPANVADVYEAVKAFFDFNEGAKLCNIANLPVDDGHNRIFSRDEEPGIGKSLLDAEGDTSVAGLDVQDNDIDFVSNFEKLRRMLGLFGPAQLGDVDEAFDALLEFDEDAIVDDANEF